MYKIIILFFLGILLFGTQQTFAQDLKTSVTENKELDSLRKKLENGKDSIIFTSRFIRYTTLKLTKDSIQTFGLDTSLRNFQNFTPINQPRRPTINTGNTGLAARDLLFTPSKTIGFDPGFHSLDWYVVGPEDIIYYQARTQFTNLYFAGQYSGVAQQLFKVTHTQNIKKNWNIGGAYGRIGANGVYARQRGDVLNANLFSWYTSPNKRYNLFASATFNTMKAYENGSITNDSIFVGKQSTTGPESQLVRLNNSMQLYRKNTIMLKQTYFVGRIDTVAQEITEKVLPTNKVTYTLRYDKDTYSFHKNEADDHTVIPVGINDLLFTNDSTSVTHIQNEFIYSFFLRGKGKSVIKNELKLDAGIRHDFYNYMQEVGRPDKSYLYQFSKSFQNVTLLGSAGYRFSNRIDLNVDVQQIAQGRQAGDFLYEAKSNVQVSKNLGRILFGAYIQNKTPDEIYTRYFGNHYQWTTNLEKSKTVNLSFRYVNDKLGLDANAEYYAMNNYTYFGQTAGDSTSIIPLQNSGSISLLKLSLGKRFTYGKFTLESYLVYQKTNTPDILRLPEFYTFNSLYVDQTVFKVLKTNFGIDVRYNSKYKAYSYNPVVSQFYVAKDVKFDSYPIVDLWVRASLRKANIFLKYEYLNQGLQSRGYYTVYKYPMPGSGLKVGISWNFYD